MTQSIIPEPIEEPISVDDNASSLTVDLNQTGDGNAVDVLTIAAGDTNIGNVDVVTLPALVAGSANIGDVDVLTVPAPLSTTGGGTEATAHRVTIANDSTGVVSVDDNGANLSVDWAGTVPPIGAGVEATALRVTLATDSTGLVSIDDNGGSLTVDAPVGTPAAARLSDGTAFLTTTTGRLSVDPSGVTSPVSGTVTANQGTANATPWEIAGDVAQDAAIAGNPVATGLRASTAVPTAMSLDGDVVYPWGTRQGAHVVTAAPHVGLFGSQPWNLTSETAQYTTTQTSAILVNGGASERIVVTYIQIQVGGTTAGTLQVYFGTGAYSRGTNLAIFDGEFAPSATLKPGFTANGPFISVANADDILVTTSAAINPLTITVWYYVVV